MNFNLEEIAEQIINHPYFQKSKLPIENNGNHIDDPVFEHQMRTYEKAKDLVKGELITNSEAKTEFENLMNTEIEKIKTEDLLQIVSLLHDIGKIIVFNDNGKDFPLLRSLQNGKTDAPVHEYWGSLLAREILLELNLPTTAIDYITNCIRLHNSGFNFWFENIPNEKRLFEIKLRSENLHAEIIFGTYCDLFYGDGFKNQLNLPIEILNMPEAYQKLAHKTL